MNIEWKHEYIITSDRAWKRNDEEGCPFFTNRELQVGDIIELEGHYWYVERVIK